MGGLILAVLVAGMAAVGLILGYQKLQSARREAAAAAERIEELELAMATLRHDIRGILSPALLTADRMIRHADPAVKRAGETMVRTVERTTARLAETKGK